MSAGLIYGLSALFGYFVGSIPFGLILTRLAGYGDIRKIGSGNIGATNVLRTGNKTLALLTVLCDAFKAGAAAAIAGTVAGGDSPEAVTASLTAGAFGVLGHNFPVWLKFKGGKGVASTFGFILVTGSCYCSWYLAGYGVCVQVFVPFGTDGGRICSGGVVFSGAVFRIYCCVRTGRIACHCPAPWQYSPPSERGRKQN